MANGETVRIKDTGLNKVGGTETYPKVNSGNWIDTTSNSVRFEFNTKTTNNESSQSDTAGNLTFNSNEVTAVIPPRFTVAAKVAVGDAQGLQDMIMLGRSKGVKRLSGGLALIAALPEVETDTYPYVSVIIKNITPSETMSKSDEWVVFTIQMEQVR